MEVPPPAELIEQVRGLPAAAPLLARSEQLDNAYLVGGAVRDLLRRETPFDLDLVVEGDAAALARSLGPAIVHDRFGTSTVTLGGHSYDLAAARRERYPRPGALPEVSPAPIEEDLTRRDFTVNAMAIALGGSEPGTLVSVPEAIGDLEAEQLRVLHDASFTEDPTRLLRLARYASRLRFAVEAHTLELARAAVHADALGTVSGARIGAELRLAARERDPVAALEKLGDLGLVAAIADRFGLEEPELARRALRLLPDDGRPELLVLGLAARGTEPADLRRLLDRLAFESRDREVIVTVGSGTESVANALAEARSPSQIAVAVGSAPPELVASAGAIGPAEQATAWLERLRHVGLEIDGSDLEAAGVARGPAIGAGLRAALAAKLDGLTRGRADELEHALRGARDSG